MNGLQKYLSNSCVRVCVCVRRRPSGIPRVDHTAVEAATAEKSVPDLRSKYEEVSCIDLCLLSLRPRSAVQCCENSHININFDVTCCVKHTTGVCECVI